jgi:hypothetical protein
MEHRPDFERLAAAVAPELAEGTKALALDHLRSAGELIDALPTNSHQLHAAFGAMHKAIAAVTAIDPTEGGVTP